MRLPEKEYYSLKEVADQRGCTVNDLLHYAETGKLELCVTIYPGFYEVGEEPENGPFWPIDTKKEYLTGGLYSVCLHYKIYENKWLLGIRHPQKKDAYLFLSKRNNYVISKITELLVTHKEKLRFKAAHELASNNDIEKKRPAHRVRSNCMTLYGPRIVIYRKDMMRLHLDKYGKSSKEIMRNTIRKESLTILQKKQSIGKVLKAPNEH
jgi:hypothetical protein